MINAPVNQILVQVKTKYIKNISTVLKLSEIQQGSSVSSVDLVNIVGEVVAVPKVLTGEFQKYSVSDVRVGDVCIFSHEVIFNFNDGAPEDEPRFKNRLYHDGQEYFVCNPRNLYAVVRDGNIRMQNGYIMVEEVRKQSALYLPQHIKKALSCGEGILTKVGHPIKGEPVVNVQPGDTIYFNSNKLRIYQVNEKPFGILRQSQILGRKVPDYKSLAMMN